MPEVTPDPVAEIDALQTEIITAYTEQGTVPFVTLNMLLTSALVLAEPPVEDSMQVRRRRAERALKRLREAAEACR